MGGYFALLGLLATGPSLAAASRPAEPAQVLVEAESFENYGGWLRDPQFMDMMGSPYLLAHGLGRPVVNATTKATFPRPGRYRLWVRTKDWVPGHHPEHAALLRPTRDRPTDRALPARRGQRGHRPAEIR